MGEYCGFDGAPACEWLASTGGGYDLVGAVMWGFVIILVGVVLFWGAAWLDRHKR